MTHESEPYYERVELEIQKLEQPAVPPTPMLGRLRAWLSTLPQTWTSLAGRLLVLLLIAGVTAAAFFGPFAVGRLLSPPPPRPQFPILEADPQLRCGICQGTGWKTRKCATCGNTGGTPPGSCTVCNGTGWESLRCAQCLRGRRRN